MENRRDEKCSWTWLLIEWPMTFSGDFTESRQFHMSRDTEMKKAVSVFKFRGQESSWCSGINMEGWHQKGTMSPERAWKVRLKPTPTEASSQTLKHNGIWLDFKMFWNDDSFFTVHFSVFFWSIIVHRFYALPNLPSCIENRGCVSLVLQIHRQRGITSWSWALAVPDSDDTNEEMWYFWISNIQKRLLDFGVLKGMRYLGTLGWGKYVVCREWIGIIGCSRG